MKRQMQSRPIEIQNGTPVINKWRKKDERKEEGDEKRRKKARERDR